MSERVLTMRGLEIPGAVFDCPQCGALLVGTTRCDDCLRKAGVLGEVTRVKMPVRMYVRRARLVRIAMAATVLVSGVLTLILK